MSTFSWWEADVPYEKAASAKREAMYLRELEERASLLWRLKYSKEDAKMRLRGNVRWDFELHAQPRFLSKVDALVNDVWKRGGRAGGGPPSVE